MRKLNKEQYLSIKKRAEIKFKDVDVINAQVIIDIENYFNVPLSQRSDRKES